MTPKFRIGNKVIVDSHSKAQYGDHIGVADVEQVLLFLKMFFVSGL
jgi:hypothetical protein